MMGEILQEAHRHAMKVIAYFSIGWLTPIQKNHHPEWLERNAQGQSIGTGNRPKSGPWDCICLNSPYPEQTVFPELQEIVSGYPIDGIWLDIIEKQSLLLPVVPGGLTRRATAGLCPRRCPRWRLLRPANPPGICRAVRERDPRGQIPRCWSPSTLPAQRRYGAAGRLLLDRDASRLAVGQGRLDAFLADLQIPSEYDKPWETSTSRFIHGWGGWDDQPLANIQAVSARILAHGGVITWVTRPYPTGRLDTALYHKIGQNYAFIEARERWAVAAGALPLYRSAGHRV